MQEAAKVAAQWWADQLRRPPKMDNGDPETAAIAHFMQQQYPSIIPGKNIQAFQIALERKIIEEWESNGKKSVLIEVDYHPDDILKAAAQESGIRLISGVLPIKTLTWVDPGQVELKHGYGAKFQIIFGGVKNEQ